MTKSSPRNLQAPRSWLSETLIRKYDLLMARELSRRLYQRSTQIQLNVKFPTVYFILEVLTVWRRAARSIGARCFSAQYGLDGVFFAGGYPLEALEKAVGESEFAVAIAQPDDVVRSRKKMQPTSSGDNDLV